MGKSKKTFDFSEHKPVTVALGERSYEIVIGNDLLARTGELLASVTRSNKVFVITDENVAKYHLETVEQSLQQQGITYEIIILRPGEQTKNFLVLEFVLNEILNHRPERHTPLIALGGGVIGDLTGFAASILLRGVPFIQIPTTLLAQVDSSVGGKTGINSQQGKNLIGSFYQPKLVIADSAALDSLSKREFLAGYAEVVKYGLIDKPEFFAMLENNVAGIKARDKQLIEQCVRISCEAKAEIVAKDEREGGVRALLNLGHTFGHALEVETGYSDALNHGEGVALGMVLAFQLSVRLGYCQQEDLDRVSQHLSAVGLPTKLQDIRKHWDIKRLVEAMYQDKKVEGGNLVFILTRGIGKAFIAKEVSEEVVIKLLKELL